MDSYKGWVLTALGCAVILALVWPTRAGSPEEREALREGRTIITYWNRHTGHEHEERLRLIEEFNNSQDEVYVRALSIGYNMEKLLTAIAGGQPPDVCSLEGPILSQMVGEGAFEPLDDFIGDAPHLDAGDFFPNALNAVSAEGRIWGIPTTTNVMALLWNRDAFRRAGLDPDRPPRNIEELEEYTAKLTIRGEGGQLEQIGFLPWLLWDHSFMWGGLFGGAWYDPIEDRILAAEDPALLESYRWQQSFTIDPARPLDEQPVYALHPGRIEAFTTGFGSYQSANNPFYSGRLAMIIEGQWQVTFTEMYAPDLDWGVAAIPQPEDAPPRVYAPTAVLDAIPRGSQNPEAARKYLEWFYSPRGEEGRTPASDYAYAISNIPAIAEDAQQDRFMDDPKFRVFVEELLNKPAITYPTIPITRYFLDELERYREYTVFRRLTPEEAIEAVQRSASEELRRARRHQERLTQ